MALRAVSTGTSLVFEHVDRPSARSRSRRAFSWPGMEQLVAITWQRALGALVSLVFMLVMLYVFVAALALPRLTGGTAMSVVSGSMEPAYGVGDVVVTYPVEDPRSLRKGEVISFTPFVEDPVIVTHRVVGWTHEGPGDGSVDWLVTKGDANPGVDQLIQPEQVVGKVAYSVPWVGYPARLLASHRVATMLGIGAFFFGYSFVLGRRAQLGHLAPAPVVTEPTKPGKPAGK